MSSNKDSEQHAHQEPPLTLQPYFCLKENNKQLTMKLSTAFLLAAPAVAFTPGATFSRPVSSLMMSTEAETETKVRSPVCRGISFSRN